MNGWTFKEGRNLSSQEVKQAMARPWLRLPVWLAHGVIIWWSPGDGFWARIPHNKGQSALLTCSVPWMLPGMIRTMQVTRADWDGLFEQLKSKVDES